jgi:hypothetical protein
MVKAIDFFLLFPVALLFLHAFQMSCPPFMIPDALSLSMFRIGSRLI